MSHVTYIILLHFVAQACLADIPAKHHGGHIWHNSEKIRPHMTTKARRFPSIGLTSSGSHRWANRPSPITRAQSIKNPKSLEIPKAEARRVLQASPNTNFLEKRNAELLRTRATLEARIGDLERVASIDKMVNMQTISSTKANGQKGLTLTRNFRLTDSPDDLNDIEESEWCDILDDGTPDPLCKEETAKEFLVALRSRASWLVGLLLVQSFSGIVLADYKTLIQTHPSIILFLTMVIGSGGNAGNQAAVRIIRGKATGSLTDRTQWQFLQREFKMAAAIGVIMAFVGFARVAAFDTAPQDTAAITISLLLVVCTSIGLGAVLPILFDRVGIDATHASTTIQVVMDILGVLIVCAISQAIFGSEQLSSAVVPSSNGIAALPIQRADLDFTTLGTTNDDHKAVNRAKEPLGISGNQTTATRLWERICMFLKSSPFRKNFIVASTLTHVPQYMELHCLRSPHRQRVRIR